MDWQNWFFDWESAKTESQQSRKPILLQFHRDTCSGCRKLYVTTYLAETVQQELYQWFVPVRLDILKDRQVRRLYSAQWTPSFYFVDHRERLYYQLPGYLNELDFRLLMRLGLASVLMPGGKYDQAISILEDHWDNFKENPQAASLLFRKGMAIYLKTRDNLQFRNIMQQIQENYPQSPQARQWPWIEGGFSKNSQ
ncbi:MAG: thioredoxin family protein [Calditrichia bacterium]